MPKFRQVSSKPLLMNRNLTHMPKFRQVSCVCLNLGRLSEASMPKFRQDYSEAGMPKFRQVECSKHA